MSNIQRPSGRPTLGELGKIINQIRLAIMGQGEATDKISTTVAQIVSDGVTVDGVDGFRIPSAPEALVVTGLFNSIMLEWGGTNYKGHFATEIWRNEVDDLGTATLIGTTAAAMYVDQPPDSKLGTTYYYWIRFVNRNIPPNYGPYNAQAGTPGSTADDPAYLLQVLTDEITEGQLYSSLTTRIDKIETTETAVINVDTQVNGPGGITSQITTLQTTVGGHTTSLQNKAEVSALNAVYEVKADVNGRVTGFGLVADAESTEFGIRADRFWISDPSNSAKVLIPFAVADGIVHIDVASIRDATITDAHIHDLSADKITAGTVTAAITTIGQYLRSSDSSVVLDMATKVLRMTASNGNYVQMTPGTMQFVDEYNSENNLTWANGVLTLPHARVNTIHIAGDAVTIPTMISGYGDSTLFTNGMYHMKGKETVTFNDTAKIAIVTNAVGAVGSTSTNVRVYVTIGGTDDPADGTIIYDRYASSMGGHTTSHTHSGLVALAAGTYTFRFYVGNNWHTGGFTLRDFSCLLLGVKR